MTGIDRGAQVELEPLPRPWTASVIVREYDRAAGSGRESDWDRFVDVVSDRVEELRPDEVAWLFQQAANALSTRSAAALARAIYLVGDAREGLRSHAVKTLTRMLQHAAAEVRLTALEGLMDLDPDVGSRSAALSADPHPEIRRIALSLRR